MLSTMLQYDINSIYINVDKHLLYSVFEFTNLILNYVENVNRRFPRSLNPGCRKKLIWN